jgi:hypothetical protein
LVTSGVTKALNRSTSASSNATVCFVLADRTNNAIDLVDTNTIFLGFCGHGQFTGAALNANEQ